MTTKVAVPGRRLLRGALVLPLLLATMAAVQVAAAPPAAALEAGVRTVLISRFNSGDVAYVKAAVEYQTNPPRPGRTHFKIYCHNSNGQSVNCGAIEHAGAAANRHLDYWNESTGWSPVQYIIGQDAPLPVYNRPSADYYSPWDCFGEGADQHRAVLEFIRVRDRFGQQGSLHTVVSNTANVHIC
jgi:hypothetical protein